MKRIISLIICAVVVLSLSACGEGNTKKDNSNDVVAQGAESNFEWDGNLIVGLTEEGCRAKELVIPERCEGFGGSIFIGKDNAVETVRFLYKGIIIKHNKTEPTYTKTSLFLCEKRRFFMARTEKGVVATI